MLQGAAFYFWMKSTITFIPSTVYVNLCGLHKRFSQIYYKTENKKRQKIWLNNVKKYW